MILGRDMGLPEIGVRIYKLTLFRNHASVAFGSPGLGREPELHIRQLLSRAALFNDRARERTYSASLLQDGADYFHGYINYGTYGIASTISIGMAEDAPQEDDEVVPREVEVIQRGTFDVEEIPMYFMAYFPPNERHAYIAFQTYQTRSCALLVLGHVLQTFNDPRVHHSTRLTAQKVMLSGEHDPTIRGAPVKEVKLIRNRQPADRFDRYVREGGREIKISLSIGATRGGSLGRYLDLFNHYQAEPGDILLFDGIEFQKAVAVVDVAGKRRKVNLIGYDSSAGIIDITNLI